MRKIVVERTMWLYYVGALKAECQNKLCFEIFGTLFVFYKPKAKNYVLPETSIMRIRKLIFVVCSTFYNSTVKFCNFAPATCPLDRFGPLGASVRSNFNFREIHLVLR